MDGRIFPWGDHYDPTWSCTSHSHPDRPELAPISAYPADESVYGVRGLAGNSQTWCSNSFSFEPANLDATGRLNLAPTSDTAAPRIIRGGAWCLVPGIARSASRLAAPADRWFSATGFRCVRSWPEP